MPTAYSRALLSARRSWAALAVRYWAGESAPNDWRVQVPGGVLGVRMFQADDGEHVALAGPAELVYDGVLSLA